MRRMGGLVHQIALLDIAAERFVGGEELLALDSDFLGHSYG